MSVPIPTTRYRGSPAAGAQPVPAGVARRAVEWLIELKAEPVSPAMTEAWQRWRAAHADHERAWQRIESVNDKLGALASPINASISHAVLEAPHSPARRQAVRSLLMLLFAGGAVWAVERKTPWREWTADQQTAIGERRTLTLEDGTRVSMNTGTALDVRYNASERRLRLLAGELLITTAADAAGRPFRVETEQGEVQALGTRFTVRQSDDVTELAVFEGAVRITPRHALSAPLVLQAGWQTRFTALSVDGQQSADRNRAAWADGFIIAKGMRLADFLAELGRYSPRSLSCAPSVADLRISGSYPLNDIDRVLRVLAEMLSLQVQTVTRFWGLQTVRISMAPRAGQGGGAG